jgi:hypothetical protein
LKSDVSTIDQVPRLLHEGNVKIDDGVLDLTDGDISIQTVDGHIDFVVGC